MAILTNTDAKERILDVVNGVLRYYDSNCEGVKETDKISDIGMDSLDFVEVIMESEKLLGITIDETTWPAPHQERTVRDLVDWILTFRN